MAKRKYVHSSLAEVPLIEFSWNYSLCEGCGSTFVQCAQFKGSRVFRGNIPKVILCFAFCKIFLPFKGLFSLKLDPECVYTIEHTETIEREKKDFSFKARQRLK